MILDGRRKDVLLHADHDLDSDTLLGGVEGVLHLGQREAVGDERLHVHPAARYQGQRHRVAAQEGTKSSLIHVISCYTKSL